MNKYKNVTREKLLEIYVNNSISVSKARVLVGMTHKTFVKALKFYGFSVKGRQSKYIKLRDKEWLRKRYMDDQKSIKEIAKEVGATPGAVNSALRWLGLELRKSRAGLCIKYPNGRFGEEASNWRGGIRHHKEGYVSVYNPDHPNSTKEGYVMEHRLIMEEYLNRILDPKELVHHINGDKKDNRIENLELVTDKGTHTRGHFERSRRTELAELRSKQLEEALRKLDPNHPLLNKTEELPIDK